MGRPKNGIDLKCDVCGKEIYRQPSRIEKCKVSVCSRACKLQIQKKGDLSYSYHEDNSGCWIWNLSKGIGGYGQIRRNNKRYTAHRFFFETLNGPVPKGFELDHLCRNRACVNPNHLEVVSRQVNTQRGDIAVFNPATVKKARKMFDSGIRIIDIASCLKIHKNTVSAVVHRQTWKNI